ncbi:MAG TPA: hypothetical protein PLN56_11115 [Methanoregulaceae archaeon]|nr:MAG: hypothetical protein A4E39_00401 [Methanoregulaceae archaeon PtaB.Bin152]OPY38777.1 MAG: hypothetical protein A4E40_01219 [Methanoregulaceae archaeon PtaU1.Bin059]HPD11530.1 hypothetical protein [Methanoregulaceae archaeon]
MSKIRTFFLIGLLVLFIGVVIGVIGMFVPDTTMLASSQFFLIVSMIIMLWGYVITLDNIDKNVARNVELMESLLNTMGKGQK